MKRNRKISNKQIGKMNHMKWKENPSYKAIILFIQTLDNSLLKNIFNQRKK